MAKEELHRQILELTEIIRDDEAALHWRTMTPESRALLRLAIGQRKDDLAILKKQLAELRDC
jgi:hypothetical protein